MNDYLRVDEVVDSVSITHKFDKSHLNFLNTSDIQAGKIINVNNLPVTELKGQAKKTIKKDDILFSEIRPKNKRYAYVELDDTEDFVVSTKLMVLRNKNKAVDNKYFYYFLTNDGMLSVLQARAENRICSFPQITFDLLSDYKIRVPKLNEQEKIACFLSNIDTKIELNNRINAELEAMAKTLYDYWFVQFDFPDANGKPYKTAGGKMVYNPTLKREIPEGWVVRTLGNDLICNSKKLGKKHNLTNIVYLDTANLTRNVIDNLQFLELDKDSIPSRANMIVSKNDILYSTVRPNQYHYGLIRFPVGNMVASTGFAVLSHKKNIEYNALFYLYLTSAPNTDRLIRISESSKSSYPSISPNDILDINIVLPETTELLDNFSKTLNYVFDKIAVTQKENKKLECLRDWLLPMLMNGQVTVK